MKTLNHKNLPWDQYWAIRNKNKVEKGEYKPWRGHWYKLRAIERKRHCQFCRNKKDIEELKNCFCNCHDEPSPE